MRSIFRCHNTGDKPGIAEDEVYAALRRLKRQKVPGVDKISTEEINGSNKMIRARPTYIVV